MLPMKYSLEHLAPAALEILLTGVTVGQHVDTQQAATDPADMLLFTVTNKGNSKWD
jgi:hypothetical protein